MKFFLIAGEASGDMHAAGLMEALRRQDSSAEFVGLGGDKMAQQGCRLVQNYRQMAFMGIAAVVRNLGKVRRNFRIARQALLNEQPDVLILIDYPSFNLRMAAFCKQHLPKTRIVYYIPPKVWAWKTWRVHRIARLSDDILGIFPFEQDFYARYGYACRYVGNPTLDAIRRWESERNSAIDSHPKADEQHPVIAILPGSRPSEISHCLPTMLEAARSIVEKQPQYRIAVTAAPGIDDAFYAPFLQTETLTRDTYTTLSNARAAVVNSGTATLETALIGCPQVAVYFVGASRWLGKTVMDGVRALLFKSRFFTLVNILAKKEVIQELLAERFTAKNIAAELGRLLSDEAYRIQMQEQYRALRASLGEQPAAATAAKHILNQD